jgi:hypothetical protein
MMIGRIKKLLNRNNGHPVNGSGNGPGLSDSAFAVPTSFMWSLEVRSDQDLVGTMHSPNPFVLISYFREYTVLYGDPQPPYAVWLTHKESERRSAMTTRSGDDEWLDFLRQLDPTIDQDLEVLREIAVRTTMLDSRGKPTNADTVFERAFGMS